MKPALPILTLVLAPAAALAALPPAPDRPAAADIAWTKAPSFAEVAGAYPAGAKGASGQARLSCRLDVEGRLTRCRALSETSRGAGFGAAAVSLAPLFQASATLPNGRPAAGTTVEVQVAFAADLARDPVVLSPVWDGLPAPADFQAAFPDAASKAGVLKARVVMQCRVDAAGGLTGCAPVSEEPAGYGFGAATLTLAAKFRMKLWGADGRPVVGGLVRLPIRYELEQARVPAR